MNMNEKDERAALLPCPFCGGTATLFEENLDERFAYANKVTVRCKNCDVSINTSGLIPHGGYADNTTTQMRAIAAWNRRTTQASKVETAPKSWRLVPLDPTTEMEDAAGLLLYGHTREQANEWAKTEKFESAVYVGVKAYRAMLAAAPTPTEADGI